MLFVKHCGHVCNALGEISNWLRHHVTGVVAYLDTVELFLPHLSKGTRTTIEDALGRRVRITPCRCNMGDRDTSNWSSVKGGIANRAIAGMRRSRDWPQSTVGYRVTLHQPNQQMLGVLDRIPGILFRFDIAIDFITRNQADADYLRDWNEKHVLLLWRRRGPTHDEADGSYRIKQKGRKRRSARDLLDYSSVIKPSKIITGEPNAHLELRFQKAAACRKEVRRVTDLITLDPAKLLHKHLRLSVISERFVVKAIRETIKEDRVRYAGREASTFGDRYRASLPHRVRSFLHRYGATWIKDNCPKAAKSHPLNTVFQIPNHLTFKGEAISISPLYPLLPNSLMISMPPISHKPISTPAPSPAPSPLFAPASTVESVTSFHKHREQLHPDLR
jgi:hypothetical protein